MAWLEQTALRTQKAKFYSDSANSALCRAEFTGHDQHYHDGAAWRDVNESLVTGTVTGFVHKCDTARHAIHIGATGTRRWCPRRNVPTEYVEFGRLQSWSGTAWQNVNLGTPVRTGNKIVWSTANFDLTLANNWHRIKIIAVLKTEAARRRLRWQVSLVGLTWDNWTLVSNSDAAVVGTIEHPLAWDATQDPASEDFTPNVTITNTYSGGYVEFGGDLSGATLPITIDPTFTDGYGGDVFANTDTTVQVANADTNYTTSTTVSMRGTGSNERHGLFWFEVIDWIPATSTVDTAKLYLYATTAQTAIISVYDILAANDMTSFDTTTWNHRVDTTGWAGGHTGCGTSGTDYAATALGTFNANSGDSAGTEYATALSIASAQAWVAAGMYGLVLKSSLASNSLAVASADHATTGYRPKLVVEYTIAGHRSCSILYNDPGMV